MARVAGVGVKATQIEGAPKSRKSDEGDNEEKEEEEGKEKMSAKVKLVRNLDKQNSKIEKLLRKLKKVPSAVSVVAKLEKAIEGLSEAATEADKMPESFRVAKGENGESFSFKVEEGAIVTIRDKKRAAFSDMLEKDEMSGMTVVKVIGTRVKAQTTSGITLILPKSALQRAQG